MGRARHVREPVRSASAEQQSGTIGPYQFVRRDDIHIFPYHLYHGCEPRDPSSGIATGAWLGPLPSPNRRACADGYPSYYFKEGLEYYVNGPRQIDDTLSRRVATDPTSPYLRLTLISPHSTSPHRCLTSRTLIRVGPALARRRRSSIWRPNIRRARIRILTRFSRQSRSPTWARRAARGSRECSMSWQPWRVAEIDR